MRRNFLHSNYLEPRLLLKTRSTVIWTLVWIVGMSVLGCKPKTPQVVINSGDEVQVLRATNRGHELVVAKQGKQTLIRLVGIYTFSVWPREKTDIASKAESALNFVNQNLGKKTARFILERKEPDPRGRYLGFIEIDGIDFNQQLIKDGHAAVYTEFPFSREREYLSAEQLPRVKKHGIWNGRIAAKRIEALRETWAAHRMREFNKDVDDPLLRD